MMKELFLLVALLCALKRSDAQDQCLNGGVIRSCDCLPGFEGRLCETDLDECQSQPCQSGGTCVDQINGYQCLCLPGFQGIHCETNINECASVPCQHAGTCLDAINSFTCQCAPGFSGVICQTNINECASNPCQHGGQCIDDINSFVCSCSAGYQGLLCEIEINECQSQPCQNGAGCTDYINGFECQCVPGYSGLFCETEIDECVSSPCQSGGSCLDVLNGFTCQCPQGFSGVICQTNINECSSQPCQFGSCEDQVAGFICHCFAGYSGILCQTELNECDSMPCKNGGTCIDQVNGFDCQCPERVIIESLEEEITVEFDHFSDERCGICLDSTTYGKQCQLKCPCLNEQPCYWNQTQRQVVCDCDANYFVGPQCQQEINAKDATIYYIVVSVLLFVFVSGCLVSCKIYAKNQTCFLCTEACFDWCWCGRSRPGRIWVASVLSNTNLNDGLPSTGAVTKEIPKESKDLMTPASSSETNHKTTIVIGSTPSILETDPDSTLLPPFPQPITTEGVATTMTHESVAQAAIKAQESVAPNSQVSLQKPLTLEQLTQL